MICTRRRDRLWKIFAPAARLEGVRTLLAYSIHKGFKVYQMDVKSTVINGILEEEVYKEQPKRFVDANNKNMVCIQIFI